MYTYLAVAPCNVNLGTLQIDVRAGDRITLNELEANWLQSSPQISKFMLISAPPKPTVDDFQSTEEEKSATQKVTQEDIEVETITSYLVEEREEVLELLKQPLNTEIDLNQVYVPLEEGDHWQKVKNYLQELEEVYPIDLAKVQKVKDMYPTYKVIQQETERILEQNSVKYS